jgi:hypothetical protein
MVTKNDVLHEIQSLAQRLGLTPGVRVFENETGIRQTDWLGIYWSKWSDAVREAGLAPNLKTERIPTNQLLLKYAIAVRCFGHIPSNAELRMYSRDLPDFPTDKTLTRSFGGKGELVAAFTDWVHKNEDHHDLLPFLPHKSEPKKLQADTTREGSVYLLRSGDHYKIGRSDQLEQRIKQITVSLPEKVSLEHTIRTDDPPGIEAYWHRRFTDKRANGEWFRLTKADVLAFKKRRFQ